MNKWDNRYLKLAEEVSTWSKDPRKKIGAVIVGKNGQIISQGYNGFPRGVQDYESRYNDKETKLKYVVHAEANALYNALHNGMSVEGAAMYVHGLHVCHECAKAIIQSGINTVISKGVESPTWEESNKLAVEMFAEAEVGYVKSNYSS